MYNPQLTRPVLGQLLTYLSSSSPVGHKATTTFLHRVMSLAAARASPRESPISCSSAITVFRHVVFGRPGFLLPAGVHLRAALGILSFGILRTCSSHLSRRRLISRTALLQIGAVRAVYSWSVIVRLTVQTLFASTLPVLGQFCSLRWAFSN